MVKTPAIVLESMFESPPRVVDAVVESGTTCPHTS